MGIQSLRQGRCHCRQHNGDTSYCCDTTGFNPTTKPTQEKKERTKEGNKQTKKAKNTGIKKAIKILHMNLVET